MILKKLAETFTDICYKNYISCNCKKFKLLRPEVTKKNIINLPKEAL